MPVEDYPELAFEPTNGVPLCGNCHVAIKGDELAHVDDLKRRQRAILAADTAPVAKDVPSESALRERAYAEPSNAEAVLAWFEVADAQSVTGFYDKHPEHSTQTAWLCGAAAGALDAVGRWQDVIAVADKAMEIAEREGTLERDVERIATTKWNAMGRLGRDPEAVLFLRPLVGRFPRLAMLHFMLSGALLNVCNRAGGPPQANKGSPEAKDSLEESVRHALDAAQLAPDQWHYASHACFLLCQKGDSSSALQYGKRAFALAPTSEAKVGALRDIAWVYMANDLYGDARNYLRQALQIDDFNVDVIGEIAHCFHMEDNQAEAIRMAKRGVMLDPRNEQCRRIYSHYGCPD